MREPAPAARALAQQVAALFGDTTRAVLHYGSRAQGPVTRPLPPDSAYDFFVVVDDYRSAFQSLARKVDAAPSPALAVALTWVLPPNAIALRQPTPEGERELKCIILSLRHFERECSNRARDHFVQGRLLQTVVLAWFRNAESVAAVTRAVHRAQEGSFRWARVFLPQPFTVGQYCRTLLEVSLRHEIRPEAKGHAERLFARQEETLTAIYTDVLTRLEQSGVLQRDGVAFVQQSPPGAITRLRVRTYLRWSKVRTSLRLLKHPFLYEGWLNYLLQKIDRSTGVKIELTDRERRWPLIFLWPRAWRYLRTRPQRRR